MPKSCYIHIPFCTKICSYCDFCKLFYNELLVDKYLDALEYEIKNTYKGEKLSTIYIGGGTPSSLTIKQLEKLFKIINQLNICDNAEYTIEGNFENTTVEKLNLYRRYGVNRLSFGIESIDERNLKFLDRKIDKEEISFIIKKCRELGFDNINVDLMYALPNESMDTLINDINYVLSLNIEHISTYSLIIEEHTKLSINNTKNISEDLDYEMYKEICKRLKENDYEHYEISNFSKKNYNSKHNTTYWNNDEYYGFGLGASSYIEDKRNKNTRSISKYLEKNYVYEIEKLDINSKIEYEIMLNLRKKEGINLNTFYKKYSKPLNELYNYSDLVNNELLIEKNNHLLIPENKWYISNMIIVKLLGSEING